MSPTQEATVLDELRRTYAQLKKAHGSSWSMRLTLEEVEVLLRLADEVTELRRQTVGDWEPDFPPVRIEMLATGGIVTPGSMPLVGDRSCVVPEPGKSPLIAAAEETFKPIAERIIDLVHSVVVGPDPEPVDALDERVRSVYGVNVGREGCPRRGMIHSCPVGGCPDDAPRETAIPDLPLVEHRHVNAPCSVEPIGRVERETPPTGDGSTRAPRCATCDGEIEWMGDSAAWRHVVASQFLDPFKHLAEPKTADLGREERETPRKPVCRHCSLDVEFYLGAWHHSGNLDADPRTPIHSAEPVPTDAPA